jgi:hypothetical protein
MTTSQQHFIPTNGMYHEVSKLIGEIGRITHIRERAIASVSNAGRSRASFTNNGELSMMPCHIMSCYSYKSTIGIDMLINPYSLGNETFSAAYSECGGAIS